MKSESETMPEHLERERLSALIDDPDCDPDASEHLEACEVCRREFDLMRRMRMALSAMGPVEPPEGAWEAIESRLPRVSTAGRILGVLVGDGWVGASLRAAAAVVLFAGGVALGARAVGLSPAGVAVPAGAAATGSLAAGGAGVGASGTAAASGGAGTVAQAAGTPSTAEKAADGGVGSSPDRMLASARRPADRSAAEGLLLASRRSGIQGPSASEAGSGVTSVSLPADLPEPYRAVFSRLEALRMEGPSPAEALRDPAAAAQHLARLDALIRASREAVRRMPADPAVNDFLFQVVAERNALDRVLHVASLEYH